MRGHKWTREEDDWLKEHYPKLGPKLCVEAGYLDRAYTAIAQRARTLGIYVDEETLSRLNTVDSWARDWDCCQECGTTEVPYQGKGLCSRCYQRKRYEESAGENYCINCGTGISQRAIRCYSCASKAVWENGVFGTEWQQRISKAIKAAHERGVYGREWRQRESVAIRAAHGRGDFANIHDEASRQRQSLAIRAAHKRGIYDEEWRQKLSEAVSRAHKRGDFDGVFQSPTSIELEVAAALDIMGIEHIPQYRPDDYSRPFDEFVPPHTLIEVQGDYWHGPKRPEHQKRDAEKAQWAEDNGYKLIEIWEHEIKEYGAWALVLERIGVEV